MIRRWCWDFRRENVSDGDASHVCFKAEFAFRKRQRDHQSIHKSAIPVTGIVDISAFTVNDGEIFIRQWLADRKDGCIVKIKMRREIDNGDRVMFIVYVRSCVPMSCHLISRACILRSEGRSLPYLASSIQNHSNGGRKVRRGKWRHDNVKINRTPCPISENGMEQAMHMIIPLKAIVKDVKSLVLFARLTDPPKVCSVGIVTQSGACKYLLVLSRRTYVMDSKGTRVRRSTRSKI